MVCSRNIKSPGKGETRQGLVANTVKSGANPAPRRIVQGVEEQAEFPFRSGQGWNTLRRVFCFFDFELSALFSHLD